VTLTPERWQRASSVLAAALERPPKERSALVAEACGDDLELRAEVESLLVAADKANESLGVPDDWRMQAVRDADITSRAAVRLAAALSGRYIVEHEIGAGGMATVYLARDLRHRRPVALKVLHPELGAMLGPRRFRREIEMAANLSHPHILPLFDSGEADGLIYYTMPYVAGETLRARLLRDGPLPISTAASVVRDIAKALAYAHKHGVVHRDIKPANILIEDGHALVADFGIARAVHQAHEEQLQDPRDHSEQVGVETLTATGISPGTPSYMAPEQTHGDADIDHRTDLYALGVVAYEALTGTHPFAGRTTEELIAAHRTEVPQPLAARRPHVPAAFDALIMKMLAKVPAERPQSADSIVHALDGLVALPGESGNAEMGFRVGSRVARFVSVALLILAAAGGAAWYFLRPASNPKMERVLVVPFENATGDSSLAPLGRMAADWVAQGLAQSSTVQVTADLARIADGEKGLKEAAAQNGAGTVVSGSYYLDRDSLRVQARVTDVDQWKLIGPVPPVSASRMEGTALLEPLRQRVMAIVLVANDPRSAEWNIGAPPPTYRAYEQFLEGLDLFARGAWQDAIPSWERAAALDSAYALPVLHIIQAYLNMNDVAAADSVARRFDNSRTTLHRFDRALLDYLRGLIDGDNMAALKGARAMARAVPGVSLPHFLQAYTAVAARRPSEALDAASHVAYQFGQWRIGWSAQVYWQRVTDAHHLLGDYDEELDAARRAIEIIPDNAEARSYELRALAALGRVEEIERKLPGFEALAAAPAGRSTSVLLVSLADELLVHGYDKAGRDLLRRAVAWQRGRPLEEQKSPAAREALAMTLLRLGEGARAESLFVDLGADRPATRLAGLALLAAQRHDRTSAIRLTEQLRAGAGPHDRGRTTYVVAQIYAQMGDTTAISLLQQALDQGVFYAPEVHSDAHFAPLRADRRLRELLKPRG
jgi:tetratricopeptide (TPR) repeat protein/TolB-like protein